MRIKTISLIVALASVIIAAWSPGINAALVTLTFEGLGDFEYVENFYNGGLGGSGSGPGPNYGITFTGNTYTSIDADAGGTRNFGGEPSADTAVSFQQFSAWMNVEPGFTDGLSFYYTNPNGDSTIRVYDGINGSGNLISSLFLPRTAFQGQMDPTGNLSPFEFASVNFAGTAKSVDFIDLAHSAYVDDITLSVVPIPSTLYLLLFGLLSGLIMMWLLRSRSTATQPRC